MKTTTTTTKDKIVFVDGEDEHGWGLNSGELMMKGHYFMREMPDGCPVGFEET
jgi:hypothetical protein